MICTRATAHPSVFSCFPIATILAASVVVGSLPSGDATAAGLRAGVAKVDITNTEAGPANDRLCEEAEKKWRRLNAPHLLQLVEKGIKFKDGITPDRIAA